MVSSADSSSSDSSLDLSATCGDCLNLNPTRREHVTYFDVSGLPLSPSETPVHPPVVSTLRTQPVQMSRHTSSKRRKTLERNFVISGSTFPRAYGRTVAESPSLTTTAAKADKLRENLLIYFSFLCTLAAK